MKKQQQKQQPSKVSGKSPSDANQSLRTASNKARRIRKDLQTKAHVSARKFAKGVCHGAGRHEKKIDKQLKQHLLHVAAEYEAHRHNPTAVIPTANDLQTARAVMLWQRQEEIRQQDKQRQERLQARIKKMNSTSTKQQEYEASIARQAMSSWR